MQKLNLKGKICIKIIFLLLNSILKKFRYFFLLKFWFSSLSGSELSKTIPHKTQNFFLRILPRYYAHSHIQAKLNEFCIKNV